MLNIQLATKYSRAIFELAQEENKLDDYAKELLQVQKEIFSVPEAVKFFQNPLIPVQAKKELIAKAFQSEIGTEVLNFLMLLIDRGKIGIFNEIYEGFKGLKNQAQGILVADVVTAFPLTKIQETELTKKLNEVTGKKIEIRKHEDKGILGGITVTIGDKRIDGSARGRLSELKEELKR